MSQAVIAEAVLKHIFDQQEKFKRLQEVCKGMQVSRKCAQQENQNRDMTEISNILTTRFPQ